MEPVRSARQISISIGVILLASIAGAVFHLRSADKHLPVPASADELAHRGVSRNAEWNPLIRRLNGIDMALVPAGCFTMGSTGPHIDFAIDSCDRFFGSGRCQVDFRRIETPAHRVCFNQPFWIGENEVTNRLYGSSSSIEMYRGPAWPRDSVTWYEASRFCQAYDARLPTEAEWEFAARGPDGLVFPWGDRFSLDMLISGRLSPADVGSVPQGASWVGAFNMSGSTAEWAADWYGPYDQATEANPQGPPEGQLRVVRGGSWFSFAAFLLRSSYRDSASPDTANSTIGFRCARDLN